MASYFQLACTIISVVLNALLIHLIIYKSCKETGRYKYLMIYTALFEMLWGLFDIPAEVGSFSYGYSVMIYRVNHSWSWMSENQSNLVVLIYGGFFGSSLAVFAAHFVYRYGHINQKFGKRYTSGWKFGFLFTVPIIFGIWWAVVIAVSCWRTKESDDYLGDSVRKRLHVQIEDISYVSATFYKPINGTLEIKQDTWIGVGQMFTMVMISMFCIFFFGYRCYRELSKGISELFTTSHFAANLQKQLFCSLVVQTSIPIVLMHIPMFAYFLCPMLNLDHQFASDFMLATITLYPAIDPIPNFFIVTNYRNAVFDLFKRLLRHI